MLVFLEYDTTRILLLFSRMELAAHHSLTELTSDWSNRQSREELNNNNDDDDDDVTDNIIRYNNKIIKLIVDLMAAPMTPLYSLGPNPSITVWK
jgi:hypothetical protein